MEMGGYRVKEVTNWLGERLSWKTVARIIPDFSLST